jgi:hypothetical protein
VAHPKLEEVRAIARYLRERDRAAEVAGEARWLMTILRGSADRRSRHRAADQLEVLLASRGLLGARNGRPPATPYQVKNTQLRWLAICQRISRWERVYRKRYRRCAPLMAACERVAAEMGMGKAYDLETKERGFNPETLNKRWQEYGEYIDLGIESSDV